MCIQFVIRLYFFNQKTARPRKVPPNSRQSKNPIIFLCYVDPVSKNPNVTCEKDTYSLDETSILQVPLKQDPKNHGSTPRAARSNSLSSSSFFLFFDFSSLFHLSFSLSIYLYPFLPLSFYPLFISCVLPSRFIYSLSCFYRRNYMFKLYMHLK